MSYGEGQNLSVSERELDLLVDGQLDDSTQRDVLARLDRQPGAWRQCALTFLESQLLAKEFGVLTRAPAQPALSLPQPRTAAPAVGYRRTWRDRVPTLLMMAGSFVFALGLGLVSRSWLLGPERPGPNASLASVQSEPRQPALVLVPASPQRASEPPTPPNGWRMVTLSVPPGSGAGKPIQVPAVESDQLDEGWLRNLPGELPVDLLQALERTGHSVQRSRRLVPMPLEDGRRVVVPVDQFDVHYVGNKAYQ